MKSAMKMVGQIRMGIDLMVPGLTVRIVRSQDDKWCWCLYDAQFQLIGRSLYDFDGRVDCYLNYAAHCAMPEAAFEIDE